MQADEQSKLRVPNICHRLELALNEKPLEPAHCLLSIDRALAVYWKRSIFSIRRHTRYRTATLLLVYLVISGIGNMN